MAQTKAEKNKKLTLKEQKFVEAMADPRTKSQTEAAIKAGYSPKTAKQIASENLTKPYLLDAIEERKKRVLAHTDVTPEEVLGSAVFSMRSSMADLLDENGSFDLEKARETGAIDLIKKLRTKITVNEETGETETITEIEIYSAADARKEVAEYIGLDKRYKN